jgi:hypothetical protein
MKLAKTIQLDTSDKNIFEVSAKPNEWAISGTFAFVDGNPDSWPKKHQFAFQSAWLGLPSFGYSTFVQVTNIKEFEYKIIIKNLTEILMNIYNAPNLKAAEQAAKGEIDDMVSLCDHPDGTLLAMERQIVDDTITESVRTITTDKNIKTSNAWSIEK